LLATNNSLLECVKELLNQHRWLPCSKTIPTTYPLWLPFQSKNSLYTAKELYPPSATALLGAVGCSLSPIIPSTIQSHLHLRQITLYDYTQQLKSIMDHFQQAENQKSHFLIYDLYSRINETYSVDEIRNSFNDQNINDRLWFGTNFIPIFKLALDSPFDLSPYAIKIPTDSFIIKFDKILQALNIQSRSTEMTLLNVLNYIVRKYETTLNNGLKAIQNDDFDLIHRILGWFSNFTSQEKSEINIDIVKQLYLPTMKLSDNSDDKNSDKNITISFSKIEDCYYCDQEWMTDKLTLESIINQFKLNIVHIKISVDISDALGVKPLTSKIMNVKSLSFARSWGQKEELTSRIHNLIK
ncbi:unnamed protein product, partial [Didymodactylos carnosus]